MTRWRTRTSLGLNHWFALHRKPFFSKHLDTPCRPAAYTCARRTALKANKLYPISNICEKKYAHSFRVAQDVICSICNPIRVLKHGRAENHKMVTRMNICILIGYREVGECLFTTLSQNHPRKTTPYDSSPKSACALLKRRIGLKKFPPHVKEVHHT